MKWAGETSAQREYRARSEGIRFFAYFPTQMHDGTWVWLEGYHGFLFGYGSWALGESKESAVNSRDRRSPRLRWV